MKVSTSIAAAEQETCFLQFYFFWGAVGGSVHYD